MCRLPYKNSEIILFKYTIFLNDNVPANTVNFAELTTLVSAIQPVNPAPKSGVLVP